MGNPNASLTGAIVSVYIAGEAVGALIQMACADCWGRRRFMQAMAVLVCIGSVLQTAAVGYGMFLSGRVVAGIGEFRVFVMRRKAPGGSGSAARGWKLMLWGLFFGVHRDWRFGGDGTGV